MIFSMRHLGANICLSKVWNERVIQCLILGGVARYPKLQSYKMLSPSSVQTNQQYSTITLVVLNMQQYIVQYSWITLVMLNLQEYIVQYSRITLVVLNMQEYIVQYSRITLLVLNLQEYILQYSRINLVVSNVKDYLVCSTVG